MADQSHNAQALLEIEKRLILWCCHGNMMGMRIFWSWWVCNSWNKETFEW